MGTGAFLGLIKKSRHDKSGSGPSDKGSPRDEEEGKKYSKVGRDIGGEDSSDDASGYLEDSHDDGGEDAGDDEMEREAAFHSFAEHAGIPHERRAKAMKALHSYMKACTRSSSKR